MPDMQHKQTPKYPISKWIAGIAGQTYVECRSGKLGSSGKNPVTNTTPMNTSKKNINTILRNRTETETDTPVAYFLSLFK